MPSEPTRTYAGRLTDGRTARSIEVDLTLTLDGVRISGRHHDHAPAIWLYDGLTTNVPLRTGVSDIVLATRAMPGATLFVADPGFATALKAAAPQLGVAANRLEGLRPGLAAGAAVFSIAAAVFAFDLSPSKGIASLMPQKARQTLGESVLRSLPSRTVCDAEPGRRAVQALMQRLAPDDPGAAGRIVVLDWNIVNAFAVPGGRVVLTRAIIQRAANADELAGVVAHELGHGAELHPEAGLVRSVGFWALIQMIFTGTPGALGNAGQLLAQLAYSRTAEREADDYALAMLKRAGISPKPFAGLFRRLEGNRNPAPSSRSRYAPSDLFSTHPATPERIAKIEGQPAYPTTSALDATQWQALRQICGGDLVVPPPLPSAGREPDAAPQPSTAKQAEFERKLDMASGRVAAQPNEPFNYRARAMIYLDNNMVIEALADLDRAVELAPRHAGYRNDRGNLHFRKGDYARALTDYSASIRLNPQAPLPYAARGVVHRLEKRYDDAMKDFEAALAINPRFEYAQLNRGLVHRDREQWPLALADFNAIIDRNPSHPSAYTYRGAVHEKTGERDKAIADYRKAISTPGSTNAAAARARLTALGAAP